MADRPIIFSAPMIRALLEGRKTQTRRSLGALDVFRKPDGSEAPVSCLHVEGDPLPRVTIGQVVTGRKLKAAIGDRLWVKETYLPDPPSDDTAWHDNVCTYVEWSGCGSKVSDVPISLRSTDHCIYAADPKWTGYEMRWRPSIYLPRWASRLTLIVTDVRVERLQNISRADAIAEGLVRLNYPDEWWDIGPEETPCISRDPIRCYRNLWNTINGLDAWESNPWVSAYSFRVIQSNIDKVAA